MESYINSYGQFEDDKSIVLEIIGNDSIWLAESIPAKYIKKHEN